MNQYHPYPPSQHYNHTHTGAGAGAGGGTDLSLDYILHRTRENIDRITSKYSHDNLLYNSTPLPLSHQLKHLHGNNPHHPQPHHQQKVSMSLDLPSIPNVDKVLYMPSSTESTSNNMNMHGYTSRGGPTYHPHANPSPADAQSNALISTLLERLDKLESEKENNKRIQSTLEDKITMLERSLDSMKLSVEQVSSEQKENKREINRIANVANNHSSLVEILQHDMDAKRSVLSKMDNWVRHGEVWRSEVDSQLSEINKHLRNNDKSFSDSKAQLEERVTKHDLEDWKSKIHIFAQQTISAAISSWHDKIEMSVRHLERQVAALRIGGTIGSASTGIGGLDLTEEDIKKALVTQQPSELLLKGIVSTEVRGMEKDLEDKLQMHVSSSMRVYLNDLIKEAKGEMRDSIKSMVTAAVSSVSASEEGISGTQGIGGTGGKGGYRLLHELERSVESSKERLDDLSEALIQFGDKLENMKNTSSGELRNMERKVDECITISAAYNTSVQTRANDFVNITREVEDRLKSKYSELRDETFNRLNELNQSMLNDRSEAEKRMILVEKLSENLASKIDMSRDLLEGLLHSNPEIKNIQGALVKLEGLMVEFSHLSKQVRENELSLGKMNSVVAKKEDIMELRERLAYLDPFVKKAGDVSTTLTLVQEDVVSLRSSVSNLESSLLVTKTDLQQSIQQLSNHQESSQQEENVSEKKVQKSLSNLEEKFDERIASLSWKLDTVSKEGKEREEDLADVRRSIRSLDNEKSLLQKSLNEVVSQQSSVFVKQQGMERDYGNLHSKYLTLEDRILDIKHKLTELESKNIITSQQQQQMYQRMESSTQLVQPVHVSKESSEEVVNTVVKQVAAEAEEFTPPPPPPLPAPLPQQPIVKEEAKSSVVQIAQESEESNSEDEEDDKEEEEHKENEHVSVSEDSGEEEDDTSLHDEEKEEVADVDEGEDEEEVQEFESSLDHDDEVKDGEEEISKDEDDDAMLASAPSSGPAEVIHVGQKVNIDSKPSNVEETWEEEDDYLPTDESEDDEDGGIGSSIISAHDIIRQNHRMEEYADDEDGNRAMTPSQGDYIIRRQVSSLMENSPLKLSKDGSSGSGHVLNLEREESIGGLVHHDHRSHQEVGDGSPEDAEASPKRRLTTFYVPTDKEGGIPFSEAIYVGAQAIKSGTGLRNTLSDYHRISTSGSQSDLNIKSSSASFLTGLSDSAPNSPAKPRGQSSDDQDLYDISDDEDTGGKTKPSGAKSMGKKPSIDSSYDPWAAQETHSSDEDEDGEDGGDDRASPLESIPAPPPVVERKESVTESPITSIYDLSKKMATKPSGAGAGAGVTKKVASDGDESDDDTPSFDEEDDDTASAGNNLSMSFGPSDDDDSPPPAMKKEAAADPYANLSVMDRIRLKHEAMLHSNAAEQSMAASSPSPSKEKISKFATSKFDSEDEEDDDAEVTRVPPQQQVQKKKSSAEFSDSDEEDEEEKATSPAPPSKTSAPATPSAAASSKISKFATLKFNSEDEEDGDDTDAGGKDEGGDVMSFGDADFDNSFDD